MSKKSMPVKVLLRCAVTLKVGEQFRDHEAGAQLTLSAEQAEELMRAGAAELLPAVEATEPPPPPPAE
jgi:hypothetical protein